MHDTVRGAYPGGPNSGTRLPESRARTIGFLRFSGRFLVSRRGRQYNQCVNCIFNRRGFSVRQKYGKSVDIMAKSIDPALCDRANDVIDSAALLDTAAVNARAFRFLLEQLLGRATSSVEGRHAEALAMA